MAKFQMKPTILSGTALTARIGAGTGAGNNVTDKEVGKLVKLVGDSQYNLCAAGDQIEAQIVAMEPATLDGYSIGTINPDGRLSVTFDGAQATPGTGSVAVGDYVVAGTPVAKDTALSSAGAPKVCKATTQTGMYFAWRVVSLGSGNGGVGTVGVIERVS